jgi:hypothetical protein
MDIEIEIVCIMENTIEEIRSEKIELIVTNGRILASDYARVDNVRVSAT